MHHGPSSFLVARLLLMIGMIFAVVAQLIGLRSQIALQNDRISDMQELQEKLYKQTVVGFASQKIERASKKPSQKIERASKKPTPVLHLAKSDEPRNHKGSVHSRPEIVPRSSVTRKTRKARKRVQPSNAVNADDEWRKLRIQNAIKKNSHVPLNNDGQIDWEKIDHVYYYHTRKAG
jgi:hypothetical protein